MLDKLVWYNMLLSRGYVVKEANCSKLYLIPFVK